jgi:CheY-like chemotaxis protein
MIYQSGKYLNGDLEDVTPMYSLWAFKTNTSIVPRILIVDDSPESVRTLDDCLKKLGCSTTTVTNASDALDEVTSCPYDLIFLDWMMPDVNGGQTLIRVEKILNRLDPVLDYPWSILRLPVIIFSAKPKEEIDLPEFSHFKVVDQWNKGASYTQLKNQTAQIIIQLKAKMDRKNIEKEPNRR